MLLYVNGDSHAAAAEAAVPHGWARDDGDPTIQILGKKPHPENDRVSFGYRLSNDLGWAYINDSQSGASNDRILRTTRQFLDSRPDLHTDLFVLIQWSTWEREEWFIDGEDYQVNASGMDTVPQTHQTRYKQWIIDIDWKECAQKWHTRIWHLHQDLLDLGVRHLFFNANQAFTDEWVEQRSRHDWQKHYFDPYSESGTYHNMLKRHGFQCQKPYNYHFGTDAHCFWAQYLLQYCVDNNLVESNAIRTD